MTHLPQPGQTIKMKDGAQGRVVSVGKPLASGRFAGMHVVVVAWATGREGTIIAEVHAFTVV